jgi:hypothetical protein
VMDEALLAENFQVTVAVSAKLRRQKPVFSNTSLPRRVNLAPRGELCPLVRMFTPAFTSRSEHSLFRKMEGRKEGLPPGDNFTHRGQSSFWGPASLLWVIFRPWGWSWFVNCICLPWRLGLVLSYPPATEETGAMCREIKSRRGIEQ